MGRLQLVICNTGIRLQRVFERDGQTHNRRMRHDSKRCGPLTSLARWCGVLLAAALVAGCAGPRIDAHTYRSNSHDSRAQFLILHYTAVDLATSIRILTQQRVSSHYLVTDEQPPHLPLG